MLEQEFSSIPIAVSSVRGAKIEIDHDHTNQVEFENQNNLTLLRQEQQQNESLEEKPKSFYEEFQQEMDEKSIKIDITLRQASRMQNIDLDQQFGIERKSKSLFTQSLRSLDDRNMRMQAMLSLEKYMHGFQTDQINTELEETDQWLRSQIKKFKSEFAQYGINFGVSAVERKQSAALEENPEDNPESGGGGGGGGGGRSDDEDDSSNDDPFENHSSVLDVYDGSGTDAGYFDVKDSSSILAGLLKKMKTAQDKWKSQSQSRIEKVTNQFNSRVLNINHQIRAKENQISQLHRKHGLLEKELQDLDKYGVVEMIENKFCSSQDNFEIQIQKQRERMQHFSKEIRLYTKYLKWMESSDVWNPTSSSSNTPSKNKQSKKKKQQHQHHHQSLNCDNEIPLDYHLEDVKQQILGYYKVYNQELESIVETREKMRNAASLESDDTKDILQEVQNKNKNLNQDLEKKRAQLNSELQALRHAAKVATGRAESTRKQCEELEELLNRYKRKAKGKKGRNNNTSSSNGSSGSTRQSVASPSPSPVIEHEALWPNPLNLQSNTATPTLQQSQSSEIIEPSITSPQPMSHLPPNSTTNTHPPPRSYSSVFEAHYLHYVKFILSNKKIKKKSKKNQNILPSRDVHEGFDVLRYIFDDIQTNKYLQKQFLAEYSEKLLTYKREFPFYKEETSEKLLYGACVELIAQLQQESSSLLITRNDLHLYRHLLCHIFGIYGIIYECCHITTENVVPSRFYTLPYEYHEIFEKISLIIFPKLFGGYPKNDYLKLGHIPQDDSPIQIKSKNLKNKKLKKKKIISLTLQDPLYAYDLIQIINIAISDYHLNLKSYSLDQYFDNLQKWIRDLMNKRVSCRVDKSWDVCSKIISPDNVYPITSEDRHILCGYQNLFVFFGEIDLKELSPTELSSSSPSTYQAIPSSSSPSLEHKLQSILLPCERYPSTTSDPNYLIQNIIPSLVPLIVSLDYIRKIFDEEISKHALLAGIRQGGDAELSFLKVLPTLKKAIKILTREQKKALKEEEYLKSIPEEEKEYLLDMRLIINDHIEELTKVMNEAEEESEDEDEDIDDKDRDAIKLPSTLKKAISNHLELLKETAVEEFNKESELKIKLMIKKFESTVGTIQQLREKVLDVGGKFTKPFRHKLESLNTAILTQIDENNEKERLIKSIEEENEMIQNDIKTLKLSNELIQKKKMKIISNDLEDFLLDLNSNGEMKREEIRENREYLMNECERIREMNVKLQEEYEKLKENLQSITEEMSYTRLDAKIQGVHTITSLIGQQLSRTSFRSSSNSSVGMRSGMIDTSSSSHTSSTTSISFQNLKHENSILETTHEGEMRSSENLQDKDKDNNKEKDSNKDKEKETHPPSSLQTIFNPSLHQNIVGFNRIIINILEYLGDAEIEQLGAMALDESIHADLLGGMKLVITQQQQQLELQRIQTLEQEIVDSIHDTTQKESEYVDMMCGLENEMNLPDGNLDEKLAYAVRDIVKNSPAGISRRQSNLNETTESSGKSGQYKHPNNRQTRLLRRVIVEEGADKSVLPKLITSSDLSTTTRYDGGGGGSTMMAITTYNKNQITSTTTTTTTTTTTPTNNTSLPYQRMNETVRKTIRKSTIGRKETQNPSQRPKSRASLALIVSKDHVVSSYVGTLGDNEPTNRNKISSLLETNDSESISSNSSSSLSQIQSTSSSNQIIHQETTLQPQPPQQQFPSPMTGKKTFVGVLRRSVNME